MNKIKQVIEHIKSQTGLDVIEDSYFSGIRNHNDEMYFNIETKTPVFYGKELPILMSLANKSSLIQRVSAGGASRINIFLRA